MDSRVIVQLLVHLGRVASGEKNAEHLTPAQWATLRYFASANRFSRTPSAFAVFHGTTRGTASQLIKSLEARGYLTRARSQTDGRSTRLEVADKGRSILAYDPQSALERAADALSPSLRSRFARTLQRILLQVALERGMPTFGTCASCRYRNDDHGRKDGSVSPWCDCVDEFLDLEIMKQLCINFAPSKGPVVHGRSLTS